MPLVQENTERAEGLAWALSATIKQEIDRLQPERQAEIKFLEAVSATLDEIANAIDKARRAATSEDRQQEFSKTRAGIRRGQFRTIGRLWRLLRVGHTRDRVIRQRVRRVC